MAIEGYAIMRDHSASARGYAMKPIRRLVLASCLLGAFPLLPSAKAQELTEDRRIAIAERLSESTVQVRVGRSGGSGFLVGPERFVITNAHVVRGFQRVPIIIELGDGNRRRGRVLAFDPDHDLAVLEAEGELTARPLTLATSSVRVGQTVLAFGSPFGLSGTLTQGIVSAQRDLRGSAIKGVIQTDAPINPGNSGGPLANSRGEVIGVNTAILSRSGGSHGIGFAVPVTYVQALLREVRAGIARAGRTPSEPSQAPRSTHTPRREAGAREADAGQVWIGVVGSDFEGRGGGVRVHQVVPGGPAARAGLRGARDTPPALVRRLRIPWTGHIIVAVDGRRIRGMADLTRALERRRPGERATLAVVIGDGVVTGEATLLLASPPSELAAAASRPR